MRRVLPYCIILCCLFSVAHAAVAYPLDGTPAPSLKGPIKTFDAGVVSDLIQDAFQKLLNVSGDTSDPSQTVQTPSGVHMPGITYREIPELFQADSGELLNGLKTVAAMLIQLIIVVFIVVIDILKAIISVLIP